MTRPRLSRRAAIALIGGTALAGCSSLGDDDFWDDPPPFDATDLGSVTDRPTPGRPDPIPVAVGGKRRRAFEERVARFLDPIPAPLTAATLPNGEIRAEIATGRTDAEDALERMAGTTDTLSAVAAAADACQRAATAAGIWAAVTVAGDPAAIAPSASELSGRASDLRIALPGPSAGPQEGAVVYGSIEGWIDEARRTTLAARPSVESKPDPLRAGRLVGELERVRAEVAAGEYLLDRYAGSLDRPRPIEDALASAVTGLAPRAKARFEQIHDGSVERLRSRAPDVDALIDRPYRRDEPGVRLLAEKLYGFFDEVGFVPIAWPGGGSEYASLRVRNTHWALAVLDALEALGARVDGGDALFPRDAGTVRAARSRAIDAVGGLARSASPLERWMAWRLVPAFDGPDGTVGTAAGSDRRTIAGAFGEYVWIEIVARSVPDATPVVASALAG